MAKLIVHNPPRAKLKSSGYIGDPTGTIQITENGTFNVKPYAEADVDVQPILIEKNITENGVYLASEEEADGYSKVNVAVHQPSGEAPTITENGTYDVTDYVSVKAEVPTYEEEYRQAQAELAQDNTYFSEISTAIQSKTGQAEPYEKDELAAGVYSIFTPLPDSAYSDVNFFDYDGTLLYAYTFEEALELEELPMLVSHEGLTEQEWNYDLPTIKEYAQDELPCNINEIYTSDDGSTKLIFWITKGTRIPELNLYFYLAANSSTTINWGDGTSNNYSNTSVSETLITATKNNYTPAENDMELTVSIIGGSIKLGNLTGNKLTLFGGANPPIIKLICGTNVTELIRHAISNTYTLQTALLSNTVIKYNQGSLASNHSLEWLAFPKNCIIATGYELADACECLKGIVIPNSFNIQFYASMQNTKALKTFVIPKNTLGIANSGLASLPALSSIVIPNGCQLADNSCFYRCSALTNVKLPSDLNILPSNCFNSCSSLQKIKIPKTVSSISYDCFSGNSSLQYVDLTAYDENSTVPTLANINAFNGINTNCEFWVSSQSKYDEFTTATNWSTYADRFQIKGGIT